MRQFNLNFFFFCVIISVIGGNLFQVFPLHLNWRFGGGGDLTDLLCSFNLISI